MDPEILIGFMELPAAVADLNTLTNRGKAPLFPVGEYKHGTAGEITITPEDLVAWADSFNKTGQDAAIDYDHSFHYGKGSRAAGWIKAGSAYVSDGFLWGDVEWTPQAADAIKAKEYRFISPEWHFDGKTADGRMQNVELAAATLTNRPFFKNMPAVVATTDTLADLIEDRDLYVALGASSSAKKKPYGNVTYADPGYQEDGKARYPLDTEEHVRAAWSYINQAKNGAKYKGGQLGRIKARIKAAMKRIGAQIADDMSDDEITSLLATIPVGAMNALAADADDDDDYDDLPPATDYFPGEPPPAQVDPDDGNTNRYQSQKGDEMDPKELAKLLGLPEDATPEQITTAIAEAKAKSTVAVDDGNGDGKKDGDDQSALAIAAAARRELHEMKRDGVIAEAVREAKVLPAEKEFYVAAYDRDPAGTTAFLASKDKMTLGPIGSAGGDDDTDGPDLEALAAEEFGTEIDGTFIPVESTSFKLHTAALEILEGSGKLLTYTSDEYVAAVKAAERKTGLPNVHVAMAPKSTATV